MLFLVMAGVCLLLSYLYFNTHPLINSVSDKVSQRTTTDENPENLETLSDDYILKLKKARKQQLALRNQKSSGEELLENVNEIGPYNVGGRTKEIAIDYDNEQNIVVASETGGAWYSTDQGVTWQPVDDFGANLRLFTVTQDLNDSNRFYLGGPNGTGLWYWDWGTSELYPVNSNIDFTDVVQIEMHPDPDEAGTFYVIGKELGGYVSLYKTTDDGANFTKVYESNETSVYFGVQDVCVFTSGNVLLTNGTEIWGSLDGDAPYERILDNTADNDSSGTTLHGEIAFCEMDEDIVYAYFMKSKFCMVYKSEDEGVTWELLETSFFKSSGADEDNFKYQAHDHAMTVYPYDCDEVILGAVRAYHSSDGGENWHWAQGGHADYHEFVYADNALFIVNDGGVYKNTVAQGATPNSSNLVDLNVGFRTMQFYASDYFPTGDGVVTGSQDNGTYLIDVGMSDFVRIGGGDGFYSEVPDDNPDIVFGTLQTGYIYRKSKSSGGVWTASLSPPRIKNGGSGIPFLTKIYHQECTSDKLYYSGKLEVAGSNRIYRLADNMCDSVSTVDPPDPALNECIWEGISSFYSSTPEVEFSDFHCEPVYFSNYGEMYRIDDLANQSAGDEVDITSNIGTIGYIRDIAMDPNDPGNVLVLGYSSSIGNVIKRSWNADEAGNAWMTINTNGLPQGIIARAIAISPFNSQHYLVGTDLGLYSTTDAGANWQLESNIPNVRISRLRIRPSDNRLFITTYGRGIWAADMKCVAETVVEAVGDYDNNTFSIYFASDMNSPISSIGWSSSPYLPIPLGLTNPWTINMNAYSQGIYNICANVTYENGCVTNTCEQLLLEFPLCCTGCPLDDVELNFTKTANGLNTNFSSDFTDSNFTYYWYYFQGADYEFMGTGKDIDYQFPTQGTYNVCMEVISDYLPDCNDVFCKEINLSDCEGLVISNWPWMINLESEYIGEMVSISGSTAPYKYKWTKGGELNADISSSKTEDIIKMEYHHKTAYDLEVYDARGCLQIIKHEPKPVIFLDDMLQVTKDRVGDGELRVSVVGGTGKYHYSWTGPNRFRSNKEDITALKSGWYELVVTDERKQIDRVRFFLPIFKGKQAPKEGRAELERSESAKTNHAVSLIYNNPIQAELVMELVDPAHDPVPAHLQVYTLQGALITSRTLASNQRTSIDVSSWQDGMYIARLIREGEVLQTEQLVKVSP